MVVIAAVMFLMVGLAFAALGVYQLVDSRRFARLASRAPGVVVELRARRPAFRPRLHWRWRPSAYILFFPVVRFRPAGGPEVTFESTTGTNPSQFKVGEEVGVAYDPQNPSRARVESFLSSTAFPLFLTALGSILVLFAAVLVVTAS